LGELVADTLSLFEAKGGDDAFINIKWVGRRIFSVLCVLGSGSWVLWGLGSVCSGSLTLT